MRKNEKEQKKIEKQQKLYKRIQNTYFIIISFSSKSLINSISLLVDIPPFLLAVFNLFCKSSFCYNSLVISSF